MAEATERHRTFPKVEPSCHLKLAGSKRLGSCNRPDDDEKRREAREQQLPVLLIWFTTIWMVGPKSGTQYEKTFIEISER